MKKQQTKKEFCVHVYERPRMYENIQARNAAEAEILVVRREFAGYEHISSVEVMRTCSCGYDNDTDNKKCDECGKKL